MKWGLKISLFLPVLPRIIGKAEGSGEREFYKTLRNSCTFCMLIPPICRSVVQMLSALFLL